MDIALFLGLIGSIILVVGAAYPAEKTKTPIISVKNWLFAIGSLMIFVYAILWYLGGGSIFFIVLEILVVLSCILMMLTINDRSKTYIIGIGGTALIIWSLFLFSGYTTIIFVLGIATLSLWFAFQMNSLRRDIALALGAILIAIFSYLQADRIFFWVNAIFGLISIFQAIKLVYGHKKISKKK